MVMKKRVDMHLAVGAPFYERFQEINKGRVLRMEPQPYEFPTTVSAFVLFHVPVRFLN